MSEPDVVDHLNAWLLQWSGMPTAPLWTSDVRRARDEIEHYRALYIQGVRLLEDAEALMGKIRAEALEEAARICEEKLYSGDAPDMNDIQRNYARRDCAAAIRALTEKHYDE